MVNWRRTSAPVRGGFRADKLEGDLRSGADLVARLRDCRMESSGNVSLTFVANLGWHDAFRLRYGGPFELWVRAGNGYWVWRGVRPLVEGSRLTAVISLRPEIGREER